MSLLPSSTSSPSAPSTPSTPSQTNQTLIGGVLAHASPPSIDWLNLTLADLKPHSHGLCSSVYRRSLSPTAVFPYDPSVASCSTSASSTVSSAISDADGIAGWLCVKRVAPDAQPRPHSVSREVALLDRLGGEHRNVAPLLAAVLDASDPFGAVVDLVMPLYCATLEEILQEPSLVRLAEVGEAPRPGTSVAHLWSDSTGFVHSVAEQLLSGVAFLHERDVAHRDIKPSNILLSPTGVVKIIDLGTAYTTLPLTDPLGASPQGEGEGGAKMVHQVGTGQFRAPELLFSPTHGYDAFAIDVWALGVCLALFFTPLTPISRSAASQDERQDWQRAFESSTPLSASGSDEYWEEDPLPPSDPAEENASGYIRTPLFTADRGDIGLAASIFALLGLPKTTQDWPEAEFFKPPLQRLPFTATHGKGLLSALPLYDPAQAATLVEKIIVPCLHLSARKRPSARALLAALKSGHPSS